MKCLIFFIFIYLCNSAELPLYAPGIPIENALESHSSRLSKIGETVDYNCTTSDLGAKCASDCSTLMLCGGSTTPIMKETCESHSADKPYCVEGVCTATPDPSNSQCISKFFCTAIGTFPDPTDCTKFHSCTEPYGVAQTYVCPPTYTYISSIKTCKRTTECQKVVCPTTTSALVVFTQDPAYYAYCFLKPDGSKEIIMYKCLDEVTNIYDIALGTCKYNCKAEGNFVDRYDCHWYVSCYRSGSVFQWQAVPCPIDYKFDKLTATCQPENEPCKSERQSKTLLVNVVSEAEELN